MTTNINSFQMLNNDDSQLEALKASWTVEQLEMKNKLVTKNTEIWQEKKNLNLVGGMDISFCNTDPSVACCTFVICSIPQNLKVVYEDSLHVKLSTPYIPGFLAFREVEPCLTLYNKLVSNQPELIPEVLLFDGNGILHPRGIGLASHFGVLVDVCTIGVAKNLYQMGDIIRDDVHLSKIDSLKEPGSHFFIEHSETREVLGAALKTTLEAKRPVYISVGHRINLDTAIWTVMKCVDRFRIPEPTRQADIRSRQTVRKLQETKEQRE